MAKFYPLDTPVYFYCKVIYWQGNKQMLTSDGISLLSPYLRPVHYASIVDGANPNHKYNSLRIVRNSFILIATTAIRAA